MSGADIVMIAVPTPFDGETGQINLDYVKQAAEQVALAIAGRDDFPVVIVKSTVVPGTTSRVVTPILEAASGMTAGDGFGVGVNPEFLSEGTAVDDFLNPDRIVLGGDSERAINRLADLHAGFDERVPRLRVSPGTAELIKYGSNALLATCVSFANELADVAEEVGGIEMADVTRGIAASRYLTQNGQTAPLASFLVPGCGYGGSCLPKDVAALASHGQQQGLPMRLLTSVNAVNRERATRLVTRIEAEDGSLKGKRVCVLGTAFKPGTGDVRETPALPICTALVDAGATVVCHDPAAGENTRKLFSTHENLREIDVADDFSAAIANTDVIVVATAWPQFRVLPGVLQDLKQPPLVVDGRGFFEGLSDRDRPARFLAVGMAP
ncbi:MAG: nucleotide sugar dehydrogenase, partial [Planctomycetota bacterium]